MGTLTQDQATGNYESFAETIGNLLEDKWNANNTAINDPTPKFIYDPETTNIEIPQVGVEAIAVRDGPTLPREERTSTGHDIIGDSELLEIIVQAGSIKRRQLFENEIKRILEDNRIQHTGTYIKKKNGGNSAIQDYDEILPPFIPFGVEDRKGRALSSQSSALLTVIWAWVYSSS